MGPATATADKLRELVKAGMDVARMNFSHGSHADHKQVYDLVRTTAAESDRVVGVLGDLGYDVAVPYLSRLMQDASLPADVKASVNDAGRMTRAAQLLQPAKNHGIGTVAFGDPAFGDRLLNLL